MVRVVTDFLDQTAEVFADKICVSDVDEDITYRQLKELSQIIAGAICGSGCFRKPVAIFMPKSARCLISIFGIAYSGCFYTVLDVKGSEDRNQKIIEDLEPAFVITDNQHAEKVKRFDGTFDVLIYEDLISNTDRSDHIASGKVLRTDLLCIIYTSGSTGTPKGVAISHRAVVNYIEDASSDYQNITSNDIFGNQYPFFYVASLDDIFLVVRNGATLHIIPDGLFFAPSKLVDWLIEKQINVINWVPSALELIEKYDAFNGKDVSGIRKVIFGGEVVKSKVLNYWMNALPKTIFINGYGATETTEGTTYHIVNRKDVNSGNIPLGKPLSGVELIVMGDGGTQSERGEQGELYVKSDYMSYGYYKDPERTSKVFVQNPINNKYSETIYKTGDIVEIREDGNLVFVGRRDKQIKKNGHRINLVELEETLKEIDGVNECVCLYRNEQNCIEAIYTGEIAENEVQRLLHKLFSTAMRPDSIRKIDAMPLNPNGKIDMALLLRREK